MEIVYKAFFSQIDQRGYNEVQSRYLDTPIHAEVCGNLGVGIKSADLTVGMSGNLTGASAWYADV